MAQNFRGGDREQAFLLPPDVREWLPPDHLAWFVIDAVAVMDLDAFYAAYRVDGHGRPAYEPASVIALLLYCWSRGTRSLRTTACSGPSATARSGPTSRWLMCWLDSA